MIRYRLHTDRRAQELYGNLVGVVFAVVAECDTAGEVGHAVLHCPIPGDPIVTVGVVPFMLSEVHVLRPYRRQGIAREMVARCIAYAQRRNIPLELRAVSYSTGERMDGNDLVRFYQSLGFQTAGRRHGNVCMVRP